MSLNPADAASFRPAVENTQQQTSTNKRVTCGMSLMSVLLIHTVSQLNHGGRSLRLVAGHIPLQASHQTSQNKKME
jgi:hypothetical protein